MIVKKLEDIIEKIVKRSDHYIKRDELLKELTIEMDKALAKLSSDNKIEYSKGMIVWIWANKKTEKLLKKSKQFVKLR